MIRRIIGVLGALVLLGLLILAAGITWAHIAIRRERAPLPTRDAVVAALQTADAPMRLSIINTASQAMPRSGVLDTGSDPRPQEPYVMSHPSFVLEWGDGRLLLIDLGMTRDEAIAFGGPIQTISGGAAIEPLGSTMERLGPARARVGAVIFTHLHSDHVGGITDFCRDAAPPVRVFQTAAQAERPNYTTRSGLRQLSEAACVRREPLSGGPLLNVPGFPGVFVIAAGGHTPGSQIIVAHVAAPDGVRNYAFTGDIVNNIDGVTYNIPKPFLYRWLVVPEDNSRQDELRRFLRDLRDAGGLTLLVSHDQRQLEQSGVPAFGH